MTTTFAPLKKATPASKGPIWGILLIVMVFAQNSAVAAETTGDVVAASRGGAAAAGVSTKGGGFLGDDNDRDAPCLFSAAEGRYDRYAACLAATEGLRRMTRDPEENTAEQHIEILNAMGMSVSRFNEVGREVSRDARLKEKVMEQAYLYRMLASVNTERVPVLEDSESAELIRDYRRGRGNRGRGDKVQGFCDSVAEIEQLRSDQVERSKRALRVDKLPAGVSISDPKLVPFLSPKVRAVVEAFPLQAEEIAKNHGLQSDEFNRMLKETKSDPRFRRRVQKLRVAKKKVNDGDDDSAAAAASSSSSK